jgi:transposase
MVAETLVAGVRVSEVARRWQLHPQQLFGWRYQARRAGKALTGDAGLSFVPIVAESDGGVAPAAVRRRSPIEIELADAVVRVMSGVDGELLIAVLHAVRRSSGRI